MDNLEEMDKFLERYNLPSVNQEEIENMNRPTTSTELETVIKEFPTNKSPGPDVFTDKFYQTFREEYKFYQTFREELTPVLLKLYHKFAEEGIPPSSFYEATITLIPKPDKDTTKRKITVQYH